MARRTSMWVDYNTGEVLTSSSPTVKGRAELNRLEKLAKESDNAKALTLIDKARTLLLDTETLLKEAVKEAKPPPKGKKGAKGPKLPTGIQAKVDKNKAKLANRLKEIQELVAGGAAALPSPCPDVTV